MVEGSVRRAGQRLRVTAQLIDAETGAHIWAERWDRTMEDLFDLQDELTHAIVTGVEPELGANERTNLRRKPTTNMTAWELCQRGFSEYLSFTEEGYATSFDLYRNAIEADPNFALPHAHLGRWYWMMILSGRTTSFTADLKAGIDHARRSIACDDRLDMGYISLGVLQAIAGHEKDAIDALDEAGRLNPNNARLHHARGLAYLFHEDPDTHAMEAAGRAALKLSPKDPIAWGFNVMIANAHWIRNAYAPNAIARDHFEIACRSADADYSTFIGAAVANAAVGRRDEAARYLRRGLEKNSSLTLKSWRTAFPFPVWAKFVAASEKELEFLVELGLPRE